MDEIGHKTEGFVRLVRGKAASAPSKGRAGGGIAGGKQRGPVHTPGVVYNVGATLCCMQGRARKLVRSPSKAAGPFEDEALSVAVT